MKSTSYEKAAIAQKHQIDGISDKLTQLNSHVSSVDMQNNSSSEMLNSLESEMDALFAELDIDVGNLDGVANHPCIDLSKDEEVAIKKSLPDLSLLDFISSNETENWEEYSSKVDSYIESHNIDITKNPFETLLSEQQRIDIEKRLQKDFVLKNAKCDKYDYMIAGTCGVIGGLIDILFVGAPWDSKLGGVVDGCANSATEKFAELLGWDREKALEKGSSGTASAVGFLERKYKINYDEATTFATGGKVENLSLKNHHLKSMGHSPDLIGLFFSVLNQFTSTSTFISNGEIITIDTDTFELKGGNLIAKIFCGFSNWFGHIMSDMAGSSGTIGNGGGGTGVPIPFFNLFQLMNVGEFGKNNQTFATVTTKVFEQGYDFRHGIAMAIPVAVTELLIRFMWSMKSHFYHNRSWQDSMPIGSIPELRRMLLVGHGTLCLIDGIDAAVRSGGEMVTFLSRTNLIAWVRFGQLGLKELSAWYNAGHIDTEALNDHMEKEYNKMLNDTA
jgi:hypothetical protein